MRRATIGNPATHSRGTSTEQPRLSHAIRTDPPNAAHVRAVVAAVRLHLVDAIQVLTLLESDVATATKLVELVPRLTAILDELPRSLGPPQKSRSQPTR